MGGILIGGGAAIVGFIFVNRNDNNDYHEIQRTQVPAPAQNQIALLEQRITEVNNQVSSSTSALSALVVKSNSLTVMSQQVYLEIRNIQKTISQDIQQISNYKEEIATYRIKSDSLVRSFKGTWNKLDMATKFTVLKTVFSELVEDKLLVIEGKDGSKSVLDLDMMYQIVKDDPVLTQHNIADLRDQQNVPLLTKMITKDKTVAVNNLIKLASNLNFEDPNGFTPLMLSIKHNKLDIAEAIIGSKGFNINCPDSRGLNALDIALVLGQYYLANKIIEMQPQFTSQNFIKAAQTGNVYYMEQILSKIKNINAQDSNGNTALHSASYPGYSTIAVRWLLDRKADPRIENKNGEPAFLSISKIISPNFVKEFINSNKTFDLSKLTVDQNNLLHLVITHALHGVSMTENDQLLLAGKNLIEFVGKCYIKGNFRFDGENLIVGSSNLTMGEDVYLSRGYISYASNPLAERVNVILLKEQFNFLLKAGLNLNTQNKTGNTPFHIACSNLLLKPMAEHILDLENFNPNLTDQQGFNALHWILEFRDPVLISKFVGKFPALINTQDNEGRTALAWSVIYNNSDILQVLINARAEVDLPKKGGFTPLHLGAELGFAQIMSILIKAQANVNALSETMTTPLYLAAQNGHLDAVELLFKEKGDLISFRPNVNFSALSISIHNKHFEVAEFLLNLYDKDQINLGSPESANALYWSTCRGNILLSQKLLDRGADDTIAMYDGDTVLHAASYAGSKELLKIFADRGKDINVQNKDGKTPAHLLIKKHPQGYIEVLKFLKEKNADFTLKDNEGISVMDEIHNSPELMGSLGYTEQDFSS